MAPNHGGDPLGYILWATGSHWGQKMGQNHQKLPCHTKFEFLTTPRSLIWAKNRIFGYGAKSRLEPPLDQLGTIEAKKWVKTVKNYHAPKFDFFYYSAVIDLGKKSNLRLWRQFTMGGPSWGQWGPIGAKKWVKPSKITMPSNSNFWLLRGHRFGQKIEFTVLTPNHDGEPLGSILGPMGSHWGKKMGQNRKKLPCPIIRILITPRSSIWAKNRIYGYGAKSRWGPPSVLLGANGVPLGQKKRVKTVKNYHVPKFEFLVIDLGKKSNLRLWHQIMGGTP